LARLDDLNLTPPTATKLDLEGGEHGALLGALKILQASHPYVNARENRSSAHAQSRRPRRCAASAKMQRVY
jgi:hypothetical protein